jgi:carbamoyltransferase
MIIWGMVGNSHDASLAVFETKIKGLTDRTETKLLWASLAKDFSDAPTSPMHSQMQINLALHNFGYPDEIVWYELPYLKTMRQWRAGQGKLGALLLENNITNYLKKLHINCVELDIPIRYAKHHTSHAAYGYYTQPNPEATIMCLDSIGEYETFTIWQGDKNRKLKKVFSQGYPHSIGLFYSAMTQRMGLVANKDEYQVAQAGKGISTSENLALVNDICETFIDGTLNGTKPGVKFKHNLHKGCDWYKPDLTTEGDMKRLANATQFVFELIIKSNSAWCRNNLASQDLILTGGCALNRDAVNSIQKDWRSIYVPPNPGDPGSCIGAVLALKKKVIDFDANMWYNSSV